MLDEDDATVMEFGAKQLALVRLLSCGASEREIRAELGWSKDVFSTRLLTAKNMLGRRTGLSGEALDAIFFPRAHGAQPDPKCCPRYSSPAVSVDRAYDLNVFHDASEEVARASWELEVWGLQELTKWLGGWRPADHNLSDVEAALLPFAGEDSLLYVRPEGFRFKGMVGSVPVLSLKNVAGSTKANVLMGDLRADVRDPDSSMVYHKGAFVVVPLSHEDWLKWRSFAAKHGGVRKAGKALRLIHVTDPQPGFAIEKR